MEAENCAAATPAPDAALARSGPGSVRGGVKGSLSATISPSTENQNRFMTQGRPSKLNGHCVSEMRPETVAQLSTAAGIMMRSPEAAARTAARNTTEMVGDRGM